MRKRAFPADRLLREPSVPLYKNANGGIIVSMDKKNLEMRLARRSISTSRPAFVMGIVNCTPDSFFSGSRGGADNALRLIDEGADIIDIGGESTRPGSAYVQEDEEIRRVIPVIRAVRKVSDIPISVDTRKSAVMKAAFDEGADILNDVSALEDDPDMAGLVSGLGIPVILMHRRGNPDVMQDNTVYKDIFSEVKAHLLERAGFAEKAGIARDKIILDPGIGFGKNLDGNLELISRCGEIGDGKYPVLMALSRKTCIGEMTGKDADGRLYGTLAADLISVLCGATFLRVHDVGPCVDSLNVLGALESAKKSARGRLEL